MQVLCYKEDMDDNDDMMRLHVLMPRLLNTRLRAAALERGTPATVLVRTLIAYGLDRMDDATLSQLIDEAAQAERDRRAAAGREGGKRHKPSEKT